jgi:hypothetical protein
MKIFRKPKGAGCRIKSGMTSDRDERMNDHLSTRFPEEPFFNYKPYEGKNHSMPNGVYGKV